MNLTMRNLSVLNYANGFTLWHYKGTNLALSTMLEPGFFNDAIDMFAPGDTIIITSADGGGMRMVGERRDDLMVVLATMG